MLADRSQSITNTLGRSSENSDKNIGWNINQSEGTSNFTRN